MKNVEIASLAGVPLADLNALLNGKATPTVASRLGVATVDIEAFIKGQADAAMTRRLGLTTVAAATELGTASGSQGAIGIVLGLLISK